MTEEENKELNQLTEQFTFYCLEIDSKLESYFSNSEENEKLQSKIKRIRTEVTEIVVYILRYPEANRKLGFGELRKVNAELSYILDILNLELGKSSL